MDKKKKDRPESPRAALPEMRELTYNDHKVLIPTDEHNKRLSVDGRDLRQVVEVDRPRIIPDRSSAIS